MSKKYYFFELEIGLRKEDDFHIYAYENISHIPTSKLIEIFNVNLDKDPCIIEGYSLTKTCYKKHRKYIEENIGQINIEVFEYCLRQYVTEDERAVRRLYKENLME